MIYVFVVNLIFIITIGQILSCDVLIDSEKYNSFETPTSFSTIFSQPHSIQTSSKYEEIEDGELDYLFHPDSFSKDSVFCLFGNRSSEIMEALISLSILPRNKIKILPPPKEPSAIPKQPLKNTLVGTKYLYDKIFTEPNPASETSNFVLLYTYEGISPPEDHDFIPKSIHLNTDLIESHPTWNLFPCKKLRDIFLQYGINKETEVIIYGTRVMSSSRVLMALRRCGIKNAKILNGGIEAWEKNRFPTVKSCVSPVPIAQSGENEYLELFWNESMIRNYVFEENYNVDGKKVFLLDVRSIREFVGIGFGYSFVDRRGRIPKSVFFGDSFMDLDGYSWRPFIEIEQKLEYLGISKDDIIVFYCGTGWRASALWFITNDLAGFRNVFVYDGGWNEWQRNDENPIIL